jgi:hypothetical protein
MKPWHDDQATEYGFGLRAHQTRRPSVVALPLVGESGPVKPRGAI